MRTRSSQLQNPLIAVDGDWCRIANAAPFRGLFDAWTKAMDQSEFCKICITRVHVPMQHVLWPWRRSQGTCTLLERFEGIDAYGFDTLTRRSGRLGLREGFATRRWSTSRRALGVLLRSTKTTICSMIAFSAAIILLLLLLIKLLLLSRV